MHTLLNFSKCASVPLCLLCEVATQTQFKSDVFRVVNLCYREQNKSTSIKSSNSVIIVSNNFVIIMLKLC